MAAIEEEIFLNEVEVVVTRAERVFAHRHRDRTELMSVILAPVHRVHVLQRCDRLDNADEVREHGPVRRNGLRAPFQRVVEPGRVEDMRDRTQSAKLGPARAFVGKIDRTTAWRSSPIACREPDHGPSPRPSK